MRFPARGPGQAIRPDIRARAAGWRCPAAAGRWPRPPRARAAPRPRPGRRAPGQQAGEDPDPVRVADLQPGPLDQRGELGQGEAPRQLRHPAGRRRPGLRPRCGAGVPVDAGQHRPRLGVLPGERALQDRRDGVGGEHADRAAGPQHAGDRRERGGRRVHVLKHVVADHQVRAGTVAGRPRPHRARRPGRAGRRPRPGPR